MRPIKFRVWDKDSKQMDLVSRLEVDDSGHIDTAEGYGGVYHNFELMQYTGLHDKNGREIYESDIVRVQETMDGGRIVCLEAIASVFWNKERGCWGCEGGFEGHLADYSFGTKLNVMGNVCEVVGNIYENQELLEAGN